MTAHAIHCLDTEELGPDILRRQVRNFARFVSPGQVMLTWTDDESDPQFEITLVHQPGPIFITDEESCGVDQVPGVEPRVAGERLAGSYVSSYYANSLVVLPVFDDPHDEAAVKTYTQLFPERRIVAVPGREILLGGGNVHCITQQEPFGEHTL